MAHQRRNDGASPIARVHPRCSQRALRGAGVVARWSSSWCGFSSLAESPGLMNIKEGTVSGAMGPRLVRETLESMGPAFIKLAQFLSLRPDLIPAEYCEEFLLLTDQVPSVPFETLRGVVED